MKITKKFSERLNKLIKESGLRKADISRIMGITPMAVSKWTMPGKNISEENLQKLAKILQKDPAWLEIWLKYEIDLEKQQGLEEQLHIIKGLVEQAIETVKKTKK